MPEVVEKLVTETFAFVGTGNEARDVEEFDRDGATAGDTGAVVGSAAVGEVVARAGAIDLEVANCPLRVDSGEASMETLFRILCRLEKVMWGDSAYGKLPAHRSAPLLHGPGGRGRELTDFGTCVCKAMEMVSFGARR